MASTVDQGTDSLWRSYAKQITEKLAGGGSLGKRNAVFVCPLTTQGIAAGEHIFPEVTNNQLYRAVDSLLNPTSPVYVPGEGSYFNTISTYLKHVILNKNPSNEAIIRLTRANREDEIAQVAYDAEYDKAMKRFEKSESRKPYNGVELELWARTNFPSLARKKEAQQGTAATVDQIHDEINGPAAGNLNREKTAIDNARHPSMHQPGLNMPCIAEDVDKIRSNHEGSSGAAKNVFYRPLYTIQGYASQVDDWISKPTNTPPADTITFSMKEGRHINWSHMGFENVESKASASAWCFLKASGHAESNVETLSFGTEATSSSIEVTITFQGLRAMPVGIGAWDVPDIRNLYPNLAPGAPPNLFSGLVRAERVLLGYAPGITVKFDAKTYHAATNMISSSSSAGGSVTLFGFVIGGSASGEAGSSGSSQFQDIKFDDQSFSITVPPVRSSYPCLVGVLAKKL